MKVSRSASRWSQVGTLVPPPLSLCVLVVEELERNVIVEAGPRKEAGEAGGGELGEGMLKLESEPKRFRHNTYS